jgi:hypothetical protein
MTTNLQLDGWLLPPLTTAGGCSARRLAGSSRPAINLKSEIYNLKSHRQSIARTEASRPVEHPMEGENS